MLAIKIKLTVGPFLLSIQEQTSYPHTSFVYGGEKS